MNFKDKKILVTGGAGVIGKELITLLNKEGAIIRCVDLVEKPKEFSTLKRFDYMRLDLSDKESQFLFRFEPEFVFHLAADFERSEETNEFWESNFKNNILCSHNVIEQIKKCKSIKKVIFASSYLIYDKKLYHEKECVLKEESIINPRNLTGIAKFQTEVDLEFLGENNNFNYVCARIFRAYGKGSRDIISRWIRDLLKNKEITVFSEQNSFDYIYSRDVARGLIELGKNSKNGVYNLASGKSTRISEIVLILKKHFPNLKIKNTKDVIFYENSCANIEKIINETEWKPMTDLEEGIKEIIEYEKGV